MTDIDWEQRWRDVRALALDAINRSEQANEHAAHLLAALDAVAQAAGIEVSESMTTDEAARAVVTVIERLTRERDDARNAHAQTLAELDAWRSMSGEGFAAGDGTL